MKLFPTTSLILIWNAGFVIENLVEAACTQLKVGGKSYQCGRTLYYRPELPIYWAQDKLFRRAESGDSLAEAWRDA